MKAFNPSKELKPKKYKKLKVILPILLVVVISIMIGYSLANYSVYQELQVVDAVVGEFTAGDITISVLVDGVKKDSFPTADEGKLYKGIQCNNGSTANWNEESRTLMLSTTGPDVCTVKFGSPEGLDYCINQNAGECLANLSQDKYGSQIANDDPEGNPRYIGKDPNNYVTFNDEPWQVIGVFSTYVCNDNTTGVLNNYKSSSACKQEKLLKIIKSDSLAMLQWDNNNENNWNTASLQTTLNGNYYKGVTSYFSPGLNTTARDMVANAVWTLGGKDMYTSASNGLAKHFYESERGKEVYSGRPEAFVGRVGLMFPSDYGYATGGGLTGRSTCLAKELYNWDSLGDCYNNDWLFNSSYFQWTLTPDSFESNYLYYVSSLSGVVRRNNEARIYMSIRPVVYLKSSVQIVDGTGTSGSPYKLSM